jgi:hypothetical protein
VKRTHAPTGDRSLTSTTLLVSTLAVVVVSMSLTSCTSTGACGAFDFQGSVDDTSTSNGITASVDFDFTPMNCGSSATCDLVAFVQIVRTLDLDTFTGLFPSTEKEDRATTDGWYIDRIPGRIWGYYGRNDDGSFAGTVTPGSDTVTATLFDAPNRPEAEPWLDIWWMAVTVPVCLDNNSVILDNLLGYYFWSWVVDPAGGVGDPIDSIAWVPQDQSFADAVVEWNQQAPGLGKNQFPTFIDLTP